MSNFTDGYRKEFEREADGFLFLLNKEDAKLLLKSYKKSKQEEYVRLASIAAVFDFRKIFIRICAKAERGLKEFIKCFDCLNGNFDLLNGWVEEFIEKVNDEKLQSLMREFWEERKSVIDKENFGANKLFSFYS